MTRDAVSPDLHAGRGRVGADLWWNLAGVLGANTLFLVCCAPAFVLVLLGCPAIAGLVAPVTVGPGLAGLAAYAGRLAHGAPASFWRDTLRGAGSGFGAGAALVGVGVTALAGLGLALRVAGAGEPTLGTLVPLIAAGATALVVAMAGVHALGLVGLYRQPTREALRNALLLSLRHPGSTAGLVGAGLAGLVLAGLLGGAPLVILPAALVVCATSHTLRLVRIERGAE
jgi:hypothetical protein